jgi:CRP/FNR family cyclic AMP-dependent transcriptional regulator
MARDMDSAAVLQACVLFKEMGEGALGQLAAIGRPRSFQPGEALFSEAAVADAMFVIKAGTVRLSVKDGNVDLSLGELRAGDSLGELSVLHSGRRYCTATAITAVEALEVRQVDFQQLSTLKPQPCLKLAVAITAELSRRMEAGRSSWKTILHREPVKR